MRQMYYELLMDGERPDRILAGAWAIVAYEGFAHGGAAPDPAVTMFKDLPVYVSATVPPDEMHFMSHGMAVGEIEAIS